jgi:hypothetical protein
MNRWGWMNIIETLADRDITKFDAVLNRPVYEVMTHLSYLRDYNDTQRQRIKMQNNAY